MTRSPLPDAASELGLLLGGSRRPLKRALNALQQDRSRVTRAFRRLLRKLAPDRAGFALLADFDPLALYPPLSEHRRERREGDLAYRLAVERCAHGLMRSGVPEDHAIAAIGLHLEASLRSLDRPAESRALVRLASATQWLVASAYCEDRVAGLRSLDDRERQKVSGDLHDEVGADLVVLKLYVEMIASELTRGSAASLGPKLKETLALIAHAIESVRRLTLDLGPAFLDTRGFLPALRNFVRQFSKRTGIRVRLKAPETPIALPASHETALYRVLLGALSNVAKHSKALHATVTLNQAGRAFCMVIEDDGRGFDVRARSPHRSFGLTAMRERVRGLRGRLSVHSRRAGRRGDASGTRVEARLPLRAVTGG